MDLSEVWRAWWELHATRGFVPVGMGGTFPQPIKCSEMLAWFDLNEVDDHDARIETAWFLRGMDGVYLKWAEEKRTG